LEIRGYTQLRYTEVFDCTGPELEVPADRSVRDKESFMIRRTDTRVFPYADTEDADRLGMQLQWNY
jgi:hypothetical protein